MNPIESFETANIEIRLCRCKLQKRMVYTRIGDRVAPMFVYASPRSCKFCHGRRVRIFYKSKD